MSRRAIGNWTAVIYLAGSAVVLFTFLRAPPDGLANIGVALYVFPVTAVGLGLRRLTGIEFPFTPSWFGYYWGHAAYLLPAVLICAALIRRVAGGPWRRD